MSTSYVVPLFINKRRLLGRKSIRLSCNPTYSPTVWISELMAKTPQASLREVLVRIVSALFRVRCRAISGKRKPSYFCDSKTADFDVGGFSYHVAHTPTSIDIRKCKKELERHRSPVLLVPRLKLSRANLLARQVGIEQKLAVFELEVFLSRALLFHALEQRAAVFESWNAVISEYNHGIGGTNIPSIALL
jgi:hypothetical protein